MIYTDGSRLEELEAFETHPRVPQSCGDGWVTYEHAKIIDKGSLALGDYDQNVGELTAILKALEWLKDHRHDDGDGGGGDHRQSVHIFTDSNLTCGWLTTPGVPTKYYHLVQRTRRLAAQLSRFDISLHWIPSYLGFECKIQGNVDADKLAVKAAKQGRSQGYENPDKSLGDWNVHLSIRREAARLVDGIERLFPRDPNGPALSARVVPRGASANRGKPRRKGGT